MGHLVKLIRNQKGKKSPLGQLGVGWSWFSRNPYPVRAQSTMKHGNRVAFWEGPSCFCRFETRQTLGGTVYETLKLRNEKSHVRKTAVRKEVFEFSRPLHQSELAKLIGQK